jgi:hypothetical protein
VSEPLPQSPLPIGQDADHTDSYFNTLGQLVPTTGYEELSAVYHLSNQDTATNALGRIVSTKLADQQGPKLDPQELNSKYPGLEVPFSEPMTADAAQMIATRQDERAKLEDIVKRGPKGAFYGIARFGAALLPHALDPVELGATLAMGPLFRAVAPALEAGGTLGRIAAGASAESTPLSTTIAQGLVGNSLTEPITYEGAQLDQRNYSAIEAAGNVVLGATAVPIGIHAIGAGVRLLKGFAPKSGSVLEASAAGQLLSDKKVDVQPIVSDMVKEGQGVAPGYEFNPISSPEDLKSRSFYAASPEPAKTLADAQSAVIEHDLGPGLYLSDNPAVANGYAARKLSDYTGSVHEVSLGDSKILDAGKVSADELPALAEKARSDGFDGIRYEGGNFGGEQGPAHNVVLLFDQAKAQEKRAAWADPASVPGPTPEEAQALAQAKAAPEASALFDEKAYGDFQAAEMAQKPDLKLQDIQAKEAESIEIMNELDKQGLLTRGEQNLLERLKEAAASDEQDSQLLKAAAICLTRSGV